MVHRLCCATIWLLEQNDLHDVRSHFCLRFQASKLTDQFGLLILRIGLLIWYTGKRVINAIMHLPGQCKLSIMKHWCMDLRNLASEWWNQHYSIMFSITKINRPIQKLTDQFGLLIFILKIPYVKTSYGLEMRQNQSIKSF